MSELSQLPAVSSEHSEDILMSTNQTTDIYYIMDFGKCIIQRKTRKTSEFLYKIGCFDSCDSSDGRIFPKAKQLINCLM